MLKRVGFAKRSTQDRSPETLELMRTEIMFSNSQVLSNSRQLLRRHHEGLKLVFLFVCCLLENLQQR